VLKKIASLTLAAACVAPTFLIGEKANAGEVRGPRYSREGSAVEALGRLHYTFTFRGGEVARITVEGQGNVDIYVEDENGHIIARDRGPSPLAEVSFVPERTGEFKVYVINEENRRVTYALRTN
jgi:hypothetical protein